MTALWRFGPFTLCRDRAAVFRASEQLPLRPKSFDVLCYLAGHAHRVVTKEELHAAVWPGVVVTDDSLTRCISEVRAALQDDAQAIIRTVPRRGYIFEAGIEPLDDATPAHASRASIQRRPALRVGAVLALLAALAAALVMAPRPRERSLSVVVMPFASAEPSHDVAVVMTDELTAALARLHGATVIAAATAFSPGVRAADSRAIGRELGVRYVVRASVAAVPGEWRVLARLEDTATAATVWSDEVRAPAGSMHDAVDPIVARLANALDTEVVRAEGRVLSAAATAGDRRAEDLALRCDAAALVQQGESGATSYGFCEQALAIDPHNVRALVRLATYYADRVERVQSTDPQSDVRRAREWVDRALENDPSHFAVHCANALVLGTEQRLGAAIDAAQHCRELNPSHAQAWRLLAGFHLFLGANDQALADIDEALRLSPRDPQLGAFLLFKGWAFFGMGRDEEALGWMRKAAAVSPQSPSILAGLASVLALTGRDDEAQAVMAKYLALPRTRARTLAQWHKDERGNPQFATTFERFRQGLRRAGMPEA